MPALENGPIMRAVGNIDSDVITFWRLRKQSIRNRENRALLTAVRIPGDIKKYLRPQSTDWTDDLRFSKVDSRHQSFGALGKASQVVSTHVPGDSSMPGMYGTVSKGNQV